jgi:tRNA (adenine57-N1/adenine58-N1)-methyltransferase
MNQVIKLFDELSSSTKWIAVEIEEILERIYETKKNAIRPKVKMIGHTGYIVSTRKILNM